MTNNIFKTDLGKHSFNMSIKRTQKMYFRLPAFCMPYPKIIHRIKLAVSSKPSTYPLTGSWAFPKQFLEDISLTCSQISLVRGDTYNESQHSWVLTARNYFPMSKLNPNSHLLYSYTWDLSFAISQNTATPNHFRWPAIYAINLVTRTLSEGLLFFMYRNENAKLDIYVCFCCLSAVSAWLRALFPSHGNQS